jgi:hypothetical protein
MKPDTDEGLVLPLTAYTPTGILIDPGTGGRIVNEWADRRQRCDAIFKTGRVCVGIVDAKGA